MDATGESRPPPIQLLPRQRELVEELAHIRCGENLGDIFLGALHALRDPSSPEALSQAAHSLRELMQKLETVVPLPSAGQPEDAAEGSGSLKQKVAELRVYWIKALKSDCHTKGKWAGAIDAKTSGLLVAVGTLFQWHDRNRRLRRGRSVDVVRGLDPLARRLPQDIQEAQAKEWALLKDYFIRVAHRGSTTVSEWEACLSTFEAFLHSRVAAVAAVNQGAIQDLVKEVEGDGH